MSSNNSGRRDVSPEHNSEPSSMASDDTTSTTGRDHDMAEAAVVAAAAAAAASNPPRNFGASTAASAQTHQPRPRRRAAAAAANNRRRRPRPGNAARDIVILNVGGTMFTTSAATLQSDSSYFKAMFSDRWANRDEDGDRGDGDGDDDAREANGGYDGGGGPSASDLGIHRGGAQGAPPASVALPPYGGAGAACPACHRSPQQGGDRRPFPRPEPIFIDQDARPFSLLLTYLRGGGINLLESDVPLARQVMLQAQFFGVEGFLRVVKARAYRHNFPDFNGSDDDALRNFDRDYDGLDESIADGVLPGAYFRPMPDHVVINAGGTTFETSKRTLTERSPYFESLFKRSPRDKTYFLDVDPGAFGVLLKYMRHAEFDLPRDDVAKFRCVLALAQRFEIRGFIEYVKARTYAIQSGHDPREWLTFLDRHHHPIEDSDNADAFNENYEGVDEAFVTGILPDGFFEKRET